MNKILLYLLLFCTGIASAQIVAIPDANFKSKLLAANTNNNIAKNSSGASIKVDADNDTYIEQSEVDAIYELNVSASAITDMSGIQEFDNLQVLNCQDNSITTLTVTALADLESLYCSLNSITMLNITGLANLRTLYCSENNLSAINFTGLADLRDLKCNGNAMSSLSVTNLVDLSVLECSNNNLTTLDLTGLGHLEILVCRQNYLTALDFTGLEYLVSMDCSDNQITTLDLSGCPAFNELDCSQNALTLINIKNGSTQIYDVTTAPNDWSGNTDLEFICIDESETATVNTILAANGISVNFNTYCSFVPGGDYNTITGTMLFDGDNDGCDTADAPQPFIKIGIAGAETGATFTNEAGVYNFYTLAGTFNVTPLLENSSFFTVTSTSDSVTFPFVDNSVAIDNFCIAPNGVHPDVEVVIEPLMPAVPGGQATYKVVYKNKGNQVLSGSVTFSCDESFIDYADVDPLPDNIEPNIYTWNYSNLRPFENREIKVTLDINSPSDTPPVNIGDPILFSSTITTTSGDDLPQDNTFDFDQKAVGAFNPNNIVCIEGDTESAAEIGEYLHYAVNFKNTGTAPVTSVVVKHDIDPTQFDAGSVEVLNSSHAMRAKVAGNTLEFMIPNASLAVADHGNILFKVKTRPSLVAGSTVSNKARIFFDYKFPEVTNNADTMFELLSAGGFEKDNSVTIYPNPVKNILNVTSDGTVRYVELYDMQGRLLETGIVNDISTTIDLTSRAAGMYFVKVTTDKGVKVENVIRE